MTKKRLLLTSAAIILAALIVGRMLLPGFLLKNINAYLGEHSQIYFAHMNDLDISIFRMAYRFEGIEAKLRTNDKAFMRVHEIDVSLAWRELLSGRVLADVVVNKAELFTAPDLFTAMKQVGEEGKQLEKPEDKKPAEEKGEPSLKDKLFPVRIDRVIVENSKFEFAPKSDSPDNERFHFSDIHSRISNVTPKPKEKILASFQGNLQKSSTLKGVAEIRKNPDSMDWDIDAEARHFNLTEANPLLRKMMPLTFTSGTLDLFAEAKSENGHMIGYIKPFFNKVDVVANKENFIGAKHFLIEIGTAAANLIMRRSGPKSVATKIDFTKDPPGELKMDTKGALANAIEHGFDKEIAATIEDEIKLN